MMSRYSSYMSNGDLCNVGDIVKIVNTGRLYSNFAEWLSMMDLPHSLREQWACGHEPDEKDQYILRAIGNHGYNDRVLSYIESITSGKCYIMGINGIQKVYCECTFPEISEDEFIRFMQME